MDWQDVLNQISDLPSTFKRPGSEFASWQNAFAQGLATYTEGIESLLAQIDFNAAAGSWLDTWGDLYGIPRNNGEADGAYMQRIKGTLQAPHGPPGCVRA